MPSSHQAAESERRFVAASPRRIFRISEAGPIFSFQPKPAVAPPPPRRPTRRPAPLRAP